MAGSEDLEILRKVLLGHTQVQALILKLLDQEGVLPRQKSSKALEEYISAADRVDPANLLSLAAVSTLRLLKTDRDSAEVIILEDFRDSRKPD
jgi:hypothetical protein